MGSGAKSSMNDVERLKVTSGFAGGSVLAISVKAAKRRGWF